MITIFEVPLIHQFIDIGIRYDQSNLPRAKQDKILSEYLERVEQWYKALTNDCYDKVFIDMVGADVSPNIIYQALHSMYQAGSVAASKILNLYEMGAELVPTENPSAMSLFNQAMKTGNRDLIAKAMACRDIGIRINMIANLRNEDIAVFYIGNQHKATEGLDSTKYNVMKPPFAQEYFDAWQAIENKFPLEQDSALYLN